MNKLKKNLIYNVMYQILIVFVPFITTPYISRVLMADGVGTYSITNVIVRYFYMFALLGMMTYGNKSIAKVRENREELKATFWSLYYFQAFLSIFVLIFYIIYVIIVGFHIYDIVAVAQIPYLLSALFEVSWFFYGTEQFRFMVFRNAIIKIITMILIFIFVKNKHDVWIYAFINSMSLLIGQVCLWPFLRKHVEFTKPEWNRIKAHFKPNLVLFVSVVAVSIYTLMDKIMIEILSTRAEVGYYENTEKILTMCDGIVGAIGAVMLPRISYLMGQNDHNKIYGYLSKSMKYIMMLAIAIAFGLAGIGNEFSIIFFGDEFSSCGSMLMIISLAIIFYSWENILRTQYLLPGNRDRVFVMGTIYAAIINVALNSLLIPFFGALGAVIGTVGAQFAAAGYQTYKIRRELPFRGYIIKLIPSAVIAGLMFLYCRMIGNIMGNETLTLFVQICGGGFIFVLFHIVYWMVTKDILLLGILKKFKKLILRH